MKIAGIQKSSMIDFPGKLCCVLFTSGCDLDCFYCHNRTVIENQLPLIPEQDVMAFLQKRQGLLEGVVVSGGEPTLQPDLARFIERVRALGYAVKLDSNGQRPQVVEQLLGSALLDYIAIDLKALPEDYPTVCQGDFLKTEQTLTLLSRQTVPFELRTTLYPGLSLDQLRRLLQLLPPVPRWRLNYFRMPATYRSEDQGRLHQEALTIAQVQEVAPELLAYQPNLIWQ